MINIEISSGPSQKPDRKYPYIGAYKEEGIIVLFFSPRRGFSLKHPNPVYHNVLLDEWIENLFTITPSDFKVTFNNI